MQLNISQQMKMSQQMKLAPRMIQSMEILQLPIMDLQERIEQEMLENVVLEEVSTNSEPDDENGEEFDTETLREIELAREEATAKPVEEKELVVDTDNNNEADFERLVEMSNEWLEDNVSAGSRPSSNRIAEDGERNHDAMSNMTSRPQSLHEYLLEQFSFFNCEPEIREFGDYLIHNLDHHGRLQSSLPEIVEVYGKPVGSEALQAAANGVESEQVQLLSLAAAQLALRYIQKLDPPGVGARDLKECLLLQLSPDTPQRDVLATLITSHLEDVAHRRLPIIERRTGYSLEMIKSAIEELRHLDPYPGHGFEQRPVQKVTPDLAIEDDDDGKYVVRLLDEYVPQLRISSRYLKLLKSNPDAKTKEFIKKKVESAKWLIESIEQRQNTLKRVAQTIVDFQTEFLVNGPEQIVPLKMQQVADVVGVHVTTVSRAVDDKWIQTSRGLFPLKRFFGGGTHTANGEEVAWENIRLKLKEIVDGEDKQRPFSDDTLVEQLSKQGITLARRTVTKYRKAMNIPSSRQRREY
ncbi:MAG: RNA polymerase factor sigma-54 [Planctomycetes bacterium]|nr:RNA polymerase factor sigma-54 [Planctomycetota bacterium]